MRFSNRRLCRVDLDRVVLDPRSAWTRTSGGSLGIGILVIVFAAASPGTLDAQELLARRVATSLTAGTIMLAVALAVAVALIVRPRKAAGR